MRRLALHLCLVAAAACKSPPKLGHTAAVSNAGVSNDALSEAGVSSKETVASEAAANAASSSRPLPVVSPAADSQAGAPRPPAAGGTVVPVRVLATARLDKLETENGDVPDAEKKLNKRVTSLEKCVNDEGGMEGSRGSVRLRFLVRAAGIIEGIDVEKSVGLSPTAVQCIVSGLKRKAIGVPSNDPVGATVTVVFEAKGNP